MSDIETIAELVDVLDGPSALGARFGIGQSAVSMWVHRNEIPPAWHMRLLGLVRERRRS
ncbi:helix-turn-helix domain-containing protein, partial [Limosilactobacillus reuteri]|uniref:helix-turn-helix domain-containing protein n=1 Tax=Limosilactobacillus reuteri TaxID=1598 RepID=UPI00338E2237